MGDEFVLTDITVGELMDFLNKIPGYYEIVSPFNKLTLRVIPGCDAHSGYVKIENHKEET